MSSIRIPSNPNALEGLDHGAQVIGRYRRLIMTDPKTPARSLLSLKDVIVVLAPSCPSGKSSDFPLNTYQPSSRFLCLAHTCIIRFVPKLSPYNHYSSWLPCSQTPACPSSKPRRPSNRYRTYQNLQSLREKGTIHHFNIISSSSKLYHQPEWYNSAGR